MKYNILISKGALAVWSAELEINANSKDEAEKKALKLAELDKVDWNSPDFDDPNIQIEEVSKID